MTQTKTRKALLMSVLSMVLCVAMLVGMTFAWFTDTASTGVNTIQAGNLKIKLINREGEDLTDKKLQWKVKNDNGSSYHLEDDVLWEPGAHFRAEDFYLVNDGNLAAKYKMNISFTGNTKLLEALDFSITAIGGDIPGNSKKFGSLEEFNNYEGHLSVGENVRFLLNVKMESTAGNEYQGLTLGDIKITAVATQYAKEYDSINNIYDAGATYPTNVADIKAEYGVDGLNMPAGVEIVDNGQAADGTFTITLKDKEAFLYFTQVFDREKAFEARKAAWGTEGFNKYPSEYNHANLNMWYGSYCHRITVKMGCDIDLDGASIKPFGLNGYAFNFDGNGHTIKNAKLTDTSGNVGFFDRGVTLSNVVFDNIQVTATGCDCAGVAIGSTNTNITNVTVKNSSVTGAKYTGAVVGYNYGSVTNCTVEKTTVSGQYKVGGIIGYICEDPGKPVSVTGNKLTEVDVKGENLWSGKSNFVIGKIVGNWNAIEGTCKDNTFNGTTYAADGIGEVEDRAQAGLNK